MSATGATPAWPSARLGWTAVVLLQLAYVLSFVDRTILSLLVTPIQADLHLSDLQLGLLQGLAFGLFYTLMGLPFGWLTDRARRTWIVGSGLAVWSLATIACGFANSFWALFVARMLVGVGEAALSPSAASLIADYHPPSRRGRAFGLFIMAGSLGAGAALIVGGAVLAALQHKTVSILGLAPLVGWRVAFIVVGLPGPLLALAFLVLREPPRREPPVVALNEAPWSLRPMLTTFAAHFGGFSFFAAYSYGSLAWLPVLFERIHHRPAAQFGWALGLALLIGGCGGAVTGGWLVDQARRRGFRSPELGVAAVFAALLVPMALLVGLATQTQVALVAAGAAMFCLAAPSAGSVAALQTATPNRVRGRVTAAYYVIMNGTGLCLGPVLMAALGTRYGLDRAFVIMAAGLLIPAAALIALAAVLYGRKAPALLK